MASNFKFLESDFPVLANFGGLAEQYCYTDPNSCLMKLGMIGETIVNLMFTYDKIPLPYDNSAVNAIVLCVTFLCKYKRIAALCCIFG